MIGCQGLWEKLVHSESIVAEAGVQSGVKATQLKQEAAKKQSSIPKYLTLNTGQRPDLALVYGAEE